MNPVPVLRKSIDLLEKLPALRDELEKLLKISDELSVGLDGLSDGISKIRVVESDAGGKEQLDCFEEILPEDIESKPSLIGLERVYNQIDNIGVSDSLGQSFRNARDELVKAQARFELILELVSSGDVASDKKEEVERVLTPMLERFKTAAAQLEKVTLPGKIDDRLKLMKGLLDTPVQSKHSEEQAIQLKKAHEDLKEIDVHFRKVYAFTDQLESLHARIPEPSSFPKKADFVAIRSKVEFALALVDAPIRAKSPLVVKFKEVLKILEKVAE